MRLHNNLQSGNSYKVRLLLRQLGRPYENVAVDIFKGESRTASFLKLKSSVPSAR
jgi:glutathione S-transferase